MRSAFHIQLGRELRHFSLNQIFKEKLFVQFRGRRFLLLYILHLRWSLSFAYRERPQLANKKITNFVYRG